MKVLIVSRLFYPNKSIGALRPTKIAKFLSMNPKYTVDVLTENVVDFSKIRALHGMNGIRNFITINTKNSNNIIKKQVDNNKKRCPIFRRLKELFSYILYIYDEFKYYKKSVTKIRNTFENYNIVISSFGPLSSHLIGNYIKRKYKDVLWVADFRDPILHSMTPLFFRFFNKIIQKRVIKNSNVVTAVSKGTAKMIGCDQLDKCHIVYNGYDKDDYALKSAFVIKDNFTFSYFGSLYSGNRTLIPFFAALKNVVSNTNVNSIKAKVIYAGQSKIDFISQVNKAQLNSLVESYDFLDKDKLQELENQTDCFILSSWNSRGNEGVLTGKLYEYIYFGKPIIAIVSGNKPNSELKEIFDNYQLGFCYEETNKKIDTIKLQDYISKLLSNQKPNIKHENTTSFDYKYIVNRLSQIMEETYDS